MGTIIGNLGTNNNGSGSGVPRERAPFGRVTVIGKKGDIMRLPINALYPMPARDFQGIWVQSISTGTVKVDLTLVDTDVAMNPDQDGGGHWVTDTTVAAGTYVALTRKVATAIRLTFNADAIVFIAGV